MSIINSANPGSQINLLCMIFRVIHRSSGKLSFDEVHEICRPETLPTKPDHQKRLSDNLRFWMQEPHQLWREDDNSKLVLSRQVDEASPEKIASATSDALHSEVYADLFESRNHDVIPLFRCLGAILVADRYTIESGDSLNNAELDELFARLGLEYPPNDSEKRYVLAYGHFLGYLEPIDGGNYVVDVTRALRRVVIGMLEKDSGVDISEFIDRLGSKLPMLDGGAYQEQIRGQLREPTAFVRDSRTISRALSLALERLRVSGLIRLDHKADDPNTLYIQLAEQRRPVSRVELLS